jgi:hypothetical protein
MQLDERISANVTIVTVMGDITLNSGGAVMLKDKVNSLLHQGVRYL